MKRIIIAGIIGAFVGIAGMLVFINFNHQPEKAMPDPLKSKILFSTTETEGKISVLKKG